MSSGEILFEIADMLNLETAKIGVALMNVNNDISELERRLTQAKMQYWNSIRKDVYPDANRTLRFSYGHIKGYSPRDAVYYKPFTTMKGVIEKETGLDPFEVPELLKKIYDEKDFNGLSLKKLDVMPVNFLSTNDITGGSSGSPVLNAKGELVGCAFDGNWEAITSDYEFIPELTRCINVDVRYILLITEKYGAGQLLKEMKVK